MKIEDHASLKNWLVKTLNPRCKSSDPEMLADYVITLIKNDKPEKDLKEICCSDLDVFLSGVNSFVEELFEYLKGYKYGFESDHRSSHVQSRFKSPAYSEKRIWKEKSHSNEKRSRNDRRQFFSPPLHLKERDKVLRKRSFTRSDSRISSNRSCTPDNLRFSDKHGRAYSERSSISPGSECSAAKRSRVDESSDRSMSPEPFKSKNAKNSGESSNTEQNIVYQSGFAYKGPVPTHNFPPNYSQPPPSLAFPQTLIPPTQPHPNFPPFPQQNMFVYVPQRPDGFPSLPANAMQHPIYASQPPILQPTLLPSNQPTLVPSNAANVYPQNINSYPPSQSIVPNNPANVFAPNNPQYLTMPPGSHYINNPQINIPYSINSQHFSQNIYSLNTQNTANLQSSITSNTHFSVNTQSDNLSTNQPYIDNNSAINPSNVVNAQYNMPINAVNAQFSQSNYVPNNQIPTLSSVERSISFNATVSQNISQYATGVQNIENSQINNQLNTNVQTVTTQEVKDQGDSKHLDSVTNKFQGISQQNNQLNSQIVTKKSDHPGVSLASKGSTFSSNTTLELRKIPKEDNTIANINNHFSKFGIIVNLQVGWDNDPQAALVSFASNAQASAAYKSKEPFLNNRFIKIFWHSQDKSGQIGSTCSNTSTVDTTTTGSVAGFVSAQDSEWKTKAKSVIPQRHQLQLNNTLKNSKSLVSPPQTFFQPPQVDDQLSDIAGVSKVEASLTDDVIPQIDLNPMATCENDIEMSEIDIVLAVAGHYKKDQMLPPAIGLPQEGGRLAVEESGVLKPPPTLAATKARPPLGSNALKIDHTAPKVNGVAAKNIEIRKEKQLLLEKCICRQKELLSKLEKGKASMSIDERNKYLQMIKNQEEFMNTLKAELSKPVGPLIKSASNNSHQSDLSKPISKYKDQSSYAKPSTSASQQSNFLVNRAHKLVRNPESSDKKVENMSSENSSEMENINLASKSQTTLPQFKHRTKLGRFGRVMDRRPKQLMIEGFEGEDSPELISHMAVYGEIESSRFEASIPCMFVTYKYRQCGEKVIYEGVTFNGQKLKITWSDGKPQKLQQVVSGEMEVEKSAPEVNDAGRPRAVDRVGNESESSISPVITSYSLRQGDRRSSSGSQAFNESEYHIDIGLQYSSDEDSSSDDVILGVRRDEDEEEDEEGRSWRK